MVSSLPAIPAAASTKWVWPYLLEVGDLCVFTGKVYEHASVHHRVIYQVVEKKDNLDTTFSSHSYKYRAVFDIENPTGSPMDITGFMGSREMKKISLLDLGVIRILFDAFIKDYAKSCGTGIEYLPTSDDVG